ncbi:UNVERIFIED_CONTAM: LOB domain-containing protein 22 [Sesamum latifolium]|uniref:LOB domain-containing protein 22 n=1 Tax=Sesamum latifolium TaxID=2727402 RepID=A0AAW2SP07_9LAMI
MNSPDKNPTPTTKLPSPTDLPLTTPQLSNRGGAGAGASVAQACAACKYQRRRCAPDCLLAPFFPADRVKEFLNAHKLFGVGNIVKILKKVPQHERQNAMRSVIFEANVRARDPVGGCHRLIRDMEERLRLCNFELDFVMKKLAFYKYNLLRNDETPNSSIYDFVQNTKCKRAVGVGSVRFAGCSDEDLIKVEMVEQFLNDKPTRLSNETEDPKSDVFLEKHKESKESWSDCIVSSLVVWFAPSKRLVQKLAQAKHECALSFLFIMEARQEAGGGSERPQAISSGLHCQNLKTVPHHQRQDAIRSLVFEANMRALDPVGGCHSLIRAMETRLDFCCSQLESEMKMLAFYKSLVLHKDKTPNSNTCDSVPIQNTKCKPPVDVGSVLLRDGSSSQVPHLAKAGCCGDETIEVQFLSIEPGLSNETDGGNHKCKEPDQLSRFLEWRTLRQAGFTEQRKFSTASPASGWLHRKFSTASPASGWLHRATKISRSLQWKDNRPVLSWRLASGWLHRATKISRSLQWKDNRPVLSWPAKAK